MPKVKVTRDVTVQASPVARMKYSAGFTGSVPSHHVQQIVEKGAGERVADKPKAEE